LLEEDDDDDDEDVVGSKACSEDREVEGNENDIIADV
jgi:hypothetical protein